MSGYEDEIADAVFTATVKEDLMDYFFSGHVEETNQCLDMNWQTNDCQLFPDPRQLNEDKTLTVTFTSGIPDEIGEVDVFDEDGLLIAITGELSLSFGELDSSHLLVFAQFNLLHLPIHSNSNPASTSTSTSTHTQPP